MHTNNLLVLKKAVASLAIGWTILIAFLCLVKFNDLPSIGVTEADKYVHFTFHFVFTMLWGFYFWVKLKEIILSKIKQVVIISVCYGILIEVLQEKFTKTRQADILDVMANLSGALIAFIIFILIKKQKSINNR